MKDDDPTAMFSGTVTADETFIGPNPKNLHRRELVVCPGFGAVGQTAAGSVTGPRDAATNPPRYLNDRPLAGGAYISAALYSPVGAQSGNMRVGERAPEVISRVSARPPLHWKTLRVGGPFVVITATILTLSGHPWFGVLLLLVAPVVFFGPWLLSPYSSFARRVAAPTDDELGRTASRYERWRAIPVVGAVWRLGDRMTGNAGQKGFDEYRRWRRQQDDD